MVHVLDTAELRQGKPSRDVFATASRLPITLLLDGVQRSYNIGAIIRLCDALLIEKLIVCGVNLEMHKRKLVQAAQGAQKWVPIENPLSALEVVRDFKQRGVQIAVGELTSQSVTPEHFVAQFPVCVVVGGERSGVSQEIVDLADATIAIPMKGLSNSLNVSTAAAIILYNLSSRLVSASQ